jgi:hypothetical protein
MRKTQFFLTIFEKKNKKNKTHSFFLFFNKSLNFLIKYNFIAQVEHQSPRVYNPVQALAIGPEVFSVKHGYSALGHIPVLTSAIGPGVFLA